MLNVQPVVPITINEDWNLISRTILPLVSQSDLYPGAGSQSGIGDIVQSVFFSPKAPTAGGWIWGAGPVLLLPTGSDDLLDDGQVGRRARRPCCSSRQGPWTYGALANHLWSFAGGDDRRDVDATFLQPFLSYTTPTAWTVALNTESTYDWEGEQWSVPVNCVVTKVTKVGSQLISVGGGVRYWADSPDNGPEGVGFESWSRCCFRNEIVTNISKSWGVVMGTRSIALCAVVLGLAFVGGCSKPKGAADTAAVGRGHDLHRRRHRHRQRRAADGRGARRQGRQDPRGRRTRRPREGPQGRSDDGRGSRRQDLAAGLHRSPQPLRPVAARSPTR